MKFEFSPFHTVKKPAILALIMELLGEQVLPHVFWYCQANAAAAYESYTPSAQPAAAVNPVMVHRTQAMVARWR